MKCYKLRYQNYYCFLITSSNFVIPKSEFSPELIETTFDELVEKNIFSIEERIKFISCEDYTDEILIFSDIIQHRVMSMWYMKYATEGGFINIDGKTYGKSISINKKSTGRVYNEFKNLFD